MFLIAVYSGSVVLLSQEAKQQREVEDSFWSFSWERTIFAPAPNSDQRFYVFNRLQCRNPKVSTTGQRGCHRPAAFPKKIV